MATTTTKIDFRHELEWAERKIMQAAGALAEAEKAVRVPQNRSSDAYAMKAQALAAAVRDHEKLYAKMRKAAERCTADHAHMGYDGEGWCPDCGGLTMYGRNRHGN